VLLDRFQHRLFDFLDIIDYKLVLDSHSITSIVRVSGRDSRSFGSMHLCIWLFDCRGLSDEYIIRIYHHAEL